jgi:hypothetical protein
MRTWLVVLNQAGFCDPFKGCEFWIVGSGSRFGSGRDTGIEEGLWTSYGFALLDYGTFR